MASTEGVELAGPERRHLSTLTGLRFVAAFAVFIGHAARLLDAEHREGLHWLTGGSHTGVGFFFMLSGFVLMWTLRDDDRPAAFYRRRFARIYPSHMVTWVGTLIVFTVLGFELQRPLGQVLGVLLLQAWVPDQHVYYAVNGVAWSLSAELFFYLTFPLYAKRLLAASAAARRAVIVLGAGVLIALVLAADVPPAQATGEQTAGTWMWALYQLPAVRVIEFVIGAALAVEVRRGLRLPDWVFPAALVASAATYLWSGLQPGASAIVLMTLPAFALLIVAGASRDLAAAGTVFSRPVAVRLGEWSFAFYLVHQIITHVAQYKLDELSSYATWVGLGLALLLVAVAAAAALYYVVERPAERRLRTPRRLAAASR